MIVFANILVGLAGLASLMIAYLLYGQHPKGGDAGVGYAWSLLFSLLGFFILIGLATLIAGKNNGFHWIPYQGTWRVPLLLAGFGTAMWGTIFFTMGDGFNDFSGFARYFLRLLPPLSLVSIILSVIILLNCGENEKSGLFIWRVPFFISVGIGIIAIFFNVIEKVVRDAELLKAKSTHNDEFQKNQLLELDTLDVIKDFGTLLSKTDQYQDSRVRNKALAMIKSHPNWEEELIRLLRTEWSTEALIFVASNEVDHKDRFAPAILDAINSQSIYIQTSIAALKYDYEIYEDRYSWEVERILKTADKFANHGVDFKPAIERLKRALQEPTPFKKPKLRAEKMIDQWLKSQK